MKIRSKLFIIMLSLVTTAIVVPSVVALNTFTSSLEKEITDELKIVALNAMEKLSRLMFERVADAKFLTDPGNIAISGTNNNFSTAEKTEFMRKIETAVKAYAAISIYDKHGMKIGDTRSLGLGENNSGQPFFKEAIGGKEGGGIYYDKIPTFSNSLQQYVIHFYGPLYDGNNNQTSPSGVLLLTFPLNKINDIMLEAGRAIPGNVDIDLFSNDGLLIYSNNDQKSILKKKVTDLAILDKLGKSSDRVEVEIGSNDGGIGDGGQPENKIFIGAKEPGFLDYRGNNWSLILAENTKEAFDSVTLLRNQFIMIAAIILAISIASIFILSRSISKPISKLRDITNEVSTGSFDTKIEIQKGGGDELAQLSTSFENMRRAVVSKTKEILEANEELRRKDRLKDEFINVAAHELRTPIQPILGLCEVLRDKIKKSNEMVLSPEVEQVLGIIIKDAKRLSSLAQRILDVAMLESSKLDLNLQTFDIVDVLSNFVSDFNNQVVRERKDLNIIFEFNRRGYRGTTTNKSNDYNDNNNNKIFVTADKDRVIQVISNLLSNAIKSTKEGSISVQVGINPQSEEEVIISVKDMGEGIDPAILPRLFEKFSAKSSGGIGLGLYIAKNILDAHRGRIWVENNEEGKGVTFFFTLPRSR